MRLRCKIQDRAGLMRLKQRGDKFAVTDIALYKDVALVVGKRRQVFKVPRLGQLVQIDDGFVMAGEPGMHKITADKTGTACDKDHDASLKGGNASIVRDWVRAGALKHRLISWLR